MGWNASEARTMKRRRRTSYCGAHYPDAASFKRRHGRAGLGLVVGALVTSGCETHKLVAGDMAWPDTQDTAITTDTGSDIDGLVAETGDVWALSLPDEGSRELYFTDPWGWITYRVAVVLDDPALAAWLEHEPRVLAAIDELLGAYPVQRFDGSSDLGPVEAEIAQLLADLCSGGAGSSTDGFVSLTLHIDAYEDEGDILGDTKEVR